MPTIQQLVRKGRQARLKQVNPLLWIHAHKDEGFA